MYLAFFMFKRMYMWFDIYTVSEWKRPSLYKILYLVEILTELNEKLLDTNYHLFLLFLLNFKEIRFAVIEILILKTCRKRHFQHCKTLLSNVKRPIMPARLLAHGIIDVQCLMFSMTSRTHAWVLGATDSWQAVQWHRYCPSRKSNDFSAAARILGRFRCANPYHRYWEQSKPD